MSELYDERRDPHEMCAHEIHRQQAEITRLEAIAIEHGRNHTTAVEQIDRLQAIVERQRAALKPFADFADPRNKVPTHFTITTGSYMAKLQLTMGDCYRARAALETEKEKLNDN